MGSKKYTSKEYNLSFICIYCNRRQAPLGAFEGTSPLRFRVDTKQSEAELNDIHKNANHTAMFYISIILSMYLFGLILIFVHYMNSSYGKWMWTLSDAWEELTPAFFNQRYVRIPELQNSLWIFEFK